ncbi:hypothetical protein AJ79_09361 [Helicocarpus griseus UAMH5409]|uniref:Uncharacterized protein n=1 Tax=Helicocarpus griseus UAMH5409 TaxID=1447875 RepID=A0A2B7WKL1_9EURO|nr:hypothetical protein AJ79_09361 [Helicocarpus griseus UAMH5409]
MYIPDKSSDAVFAWPTGPSVYEQRACPIPDPASLKKRKRDADNWDSQINGNMGICTTLIPGNAQHVDGKIGDGYSQHIKETSLGAIPSKFAPWSSPERRPPLLRPCLQPGSMKRRRLVQQQQLDQQSQQAQAWNAIPIALSPAQRQHLYSAEFENIAPVTSAASISKLSPPSFKTKFNTHDDNNYSTSSLSKPEPLHSETNKSTSRAALSPCHICHRRPTTRSILDAYADCDLCAERTCYICLRECMSADCESTRSHATSETGCGRDDGSGGKSSGPGDGEEDSERTGRKVCSWCAVEGVVEGGGEVVRCLACVAGW